MAYSAELKEHLDPQLLPWPEVTSREMFGALCYLYKDKIFAILTEDAVATKLPLHARGKAMKDHGATEFTVSGGRPFGEWTRFAIGNTSSPADIMHWLKTGYDYVKSTPLSKGKGKGKSKISPLGARSR